VTTALSKILARTMLVWGVVALAFMYANAHRPADLTDQENLGRPHAVGSLAWYEDHGYECWTSGDHPYPTHVYEHGQMKGQAAVDYAVDQIFNHHRSMSVTFCR
jgi:hypothetical protein